MPIDITTTTFLIWYRKERVQLSVFFFQDFFFFVKVFKLINGIIFVQISMKEEAVKLGGERKESL